MIFLRYGLKKPNFEHINSSRRSIYITNDFLCLPETTTVDHEGYEYRIFITDDSACQYCKKHGHTTEVCKFKQRNELLQQQPREQDQKAREQQGQQPEQQQYTEPKTQASISANNLKYNPSNNSETPKPANQNTNNNHDEQQTPDNKTTRKNTEKPTNKEPEKNPITSILQYL